MKLTYSEPTKWMAYTLYYDNKSLEMERKMAKQAK
jgi:hypothetical protein